MSGSALLGGGLTIFSIADSARLASGVQKVDEPLDCCMLFRAVLPCPAPPCLCLRCAALRWPPCVAARALPCSALPCAFFVSPCLARTARTVFIG